MKTLLAQLPGRGGAAARTRQCRIALLGGLCALWTLAASVSAAPFNKEIEFTQPDGTQIRLHGQGDEFSARFETLDGYTVVFDVAQKAYCFAKESADGKLVSTGVQVQQAGAKALGLTKGVRMSAEARKQMATERYERWEQGMQIRKRWSELKSAATKYYAESNGGIRKDGPQSSPPPYTTTGNKSGLTLLVDFSDDPATVPQGDIDAFCNGDNYRGYGNNGSVKQYYYDNSGGLLTYSNVVTIYIRVPQPKSYYNDVTKDCGTQGNLLVKDAIEAMKALPNYTTQILPTFDALTVDSQNEVVACNVFFAGANSGVWSYGLWPNSWVLAEVGAQELSSGGKKVWKYQITDIGTTLSIGTFCHENGHMLCGYPDLYDYQYDSIGGAGNFSLMGYGGFDHNPVQIDAYLKRASGWVTTTEINSSSSVTATLSAPSGPNFNHFYRFQKPGVSTEYYLVENRQQSGHDSLMPASGIAIWHVDELGDRDDQSLVYNSTHSNYELTLVQADNQWHFEANANPGDAQDLYYTGNSAAAYQNTFNDTTANSARWWDGSVSGVQFSKFSSSAPDMTFDVGAGGGGGNVTLSMVTNYISGGNGNGIVEFNECNALDVVLANAMNVEVGSITATLVSSTPGVAIAQGTSTYPNIPVGGMATNLSPFRISTTPSFICGTPIDLSLIVHSDLGLSVIAFSLPTGLPGTPIRFDNNTGVAIPPLGFADSSVLVSNINFAINKVAVSMFVEEPVDYYLKLELIAPDGSTNLLSANNGGFGQNYGIGCGDEQRTVFDDAATTPIASGAAPFVGTFIPTKPLSGFAGKSGTNVNGVWKLRATDSGNLTAAAIRCWSMLVTPTLCVDGGGQCPGADLSVGVSASPIPIIQGNSLTYVIGVTNSGPSSATNVVLSFYMPPTAAFMTATASQGTWAQSGSVLTFRLGAMGPRDSASLTAVVVPTAAGTIGATGVVSSEQPDFVPGNNSAAFTLQVNRYTAELAVGLVAAPSPTLIGSTLTYSVSVTNNGPNAASGVTVATVLPTNVVILPATLSAGSYTNTGRTIIWSLPPMAPTEHALAIILVIPAAEGLITATSTVGSDQFDPITANNTATVNTVVGAAADLALGILTESSNPIVVTSNLTYRIAVTNRGPSTATGVTVNNNLPTTLTVLSTNASQGAITISGSALTWNVGVLAPGASAIITNVLQTSVIETNVTTATVTGVQTDPNPANNSASLTTVVAAPFVSIEAAAASIDYESGPTNGAVDIGETLTLKLRLRNAGNVPTRRLNATLLAGNGVTPVTGAPPLVSANSHYYNVLWPNGEPDGHSFSFIASGTNNGSIIATLALQDGTNVYPPVTFTFLLPNVMAFSTNLVITIPDPATPNPPYPLESGPASPYPSVLNIAGLSGSLDQVTLTVSNLTHTFPGDVNLLLVGPTGAKALVMSGAGEEPAAGVTLTLDDSAALTLPASGQIASGSYKPAAYNAPAALPTNAPAGPYTSALSAFSGSSPNGAWALYVYDAGSGDKGQIANGWSLGLKMVSPVKLGADIAIAASVAPNSLLAGQTQTNVFTISNGGPGSAAPSLAVTLPAGVTVVATTPADYTVAGQVVTFTNLGTVASGANTKVVMAVSPGASVLPVGQNTVTLTTSAAISLDDTKGEKDNNLSNNSVSFFTTVNRPVADVAILAQNVTNSVLAGYALTNTVTITNRGPQLAPSVVLTPSFAPTNVSVSVVPSVLTLNAGSSATVTVIAVPSPALIPAGSSTALLTNTLVLSTGAADAVATNNTATNVFTVIKPAPDIINVGAVLAYESGPVNGAIDPGETVSLYFGLANVGTLATVDLKAVLQLTNGVTPSTTPASVLTNGYGSLTPAGSSAFRMFTFKAASNLGSALIATLQCQDASTGYSTNVSIQFDTLATTTYSSSAKISIPYFGAATPYPAYIYVPLSNHFVWGASVTLSNVTHTFPHDINVLLVSPSGAMSKNVLLMSHTSGGKPLTQPINLTFNDGAEDFLPNQAPPSKSMYKPTSYEGPVTFPGSPAPQPYGAALSALNGAGAFGYWLLYVYDDANGDAGMIADGWSLSLTTAPILTIANQPPVLSGAVYNGNFQLTVSGRANQPCIVQGSTGFGSWVSLTTNANPTGTFIYTEPAADVPEGRYYRAIVP